MTAQQALYGLPGSTFFAAPSQSRTLRPRARPQPASPEADADSAASPYTSFPEPSQALTHLPMSHSSNTLVHSGFWQLLSTTGSKFIETVVPAFPEELGGQAGEDPYEEESGAGYGVGLPGRGGRDFKVGGGGKDKVRKGMIGRPGGFTHLVHASDHEQAEALLTRWHQDRIGKLPPPTWATPIKLQARATARARAVAQVVQAREDQDHSLHIVNGAPSSFLTTNTSLSGSTRAVENGVSASPSVSTPGLAESTLQRLLEDGSPDEIEWLPSRPAFKKLGSSGKTIQTLASSNSAESKAQDVGTARFIPSKPRGQLEALDPMSEEDEGATAPRANSFDGPLEVDRGFDPPKPFVPSLQTIEKAVACKVFFETHYHSILRKPQGRDQRRALLEHELARLNISDAERRNVREAWALSETEHLRDLRARVTEGSFKKLKTIGHGAFGVVSLVEEKSTGQLYAMKQLRKADMLRKGQEGHVRAERDLLATAATSTRWTVPLAYSFQDADHLYLVMQFMGGGDLLSLLIERDTFPEAMARFYIAEIILAVQECHRTLGAIHRDIKPDNFLFDSDGHIAIADFGLATDFHWAHDGVYYEQHRKELLKRHGIDLGERVAPPSRPFDVAGLGKEGSEEAPKSVLTERDRNRRRLAYSVVGTNNYMACEVLRGTGYDQACDWWSVGVILFEMLYGYPPFVSKNRQVTRQKILTWRQALRFPSKPAVSREAQDLICRLICEKEDRLGASPFVANSATRPNSVMMGQRRIPGRAPGGGGGILDDGADEIKAHPWFRGMDWATLHLQEAPFRPELATKDDTKYFDDDIDPNPLPPPDAGPGGPPANATKDPMLRHAVEGEQLLETRKGLAFKGWTYRKPRKFDLRRPVLFSLEGERQEEEVQDAFEVVEQMGEAAVAAGSKLVRSLSM